MRYEHVISAVYDTPLAILPSTLATVVEILHLRASGERLSDEDIRLRLAAAAAANGPRSGGRQAGAIAVLPLYGLLAKRMGLTAQSSGGTSLDHFIGQFRSALADPAVDAIVIDVDSPGGSVDGVEEVATEIRAARGQKPIVAVANTVAASAAYWVAAQADELVVTPSGSVGSVGILAVHHDYSAQNEQLGVKQTYITAGKYKAEANQDQPLSDEAAAAQQAQVDEFYGMFLRAVAKGRGVPIDDVRAGFGQGRMVLATAAVEQRMADRVDTLENTIRAVARRAIAAQRATALDIQPSPTALDTEPSFSDRLSLVTANARALVEHARARADMRAKEGRTLSAADRTGLLSVADALREVAAEPLTEPPVVTPASTRRVGHLLAIAEAQAAGYRIPTTEVPIT